MTSKKKTYNMIDSLVFTILEVILATTLRGLPLPHYDERVMYTAQVNVGERSRHHDVELRTQRVDGSLRWQSADIKIDATSRATGRIFLELCSVENGGVVQTAGWLCTYSHNDVDTIMYHPGGQKLFYLVTHKVLEHLECIAGPLSDLQGSKLIRLEEWVDIISAHYGNKRIELKPANNDDYRSHGIVVPIKVLSSIPGVTTYHDLSPAFEWGLFDGVVDSAREGESKKKIKRRCEEIWKWRFQMSKMMSTTAHGKNCQVG